MSLEKTVKILSDIEDQKAHNQLFYFDPYPYQKQFHKALDMQGNPAQQRLLMAANKVGKTVAGAYETAIHLTGEYPDWWDGHRFERPVKVWCAGMTTSNTRDIVQAELLGEPGDPEDWGKGFIPKDRILTTERMPGIPNAISSITVKHITGRNSRLWFKSYEQGKEQWMGKAVDLVWLDEEPPQDIYSQGLRATLKTRGLIFMTFTPEKGMTNVVAQFMNDLKRGQQLYHATWDDAPHLDEQKKKYFQPFLRMKDKCDQRGFLFLVQDWYFQLTKTLSKFLRFSFQDTGLKSALLILVGIIHLLVFGLHGIGTRIQRMYMMFTQYVQKHLLPTHTLLKVGEIKSRVFGPMMECNMTKDLESHFQNFIAGLALICLGVILITLMAVTQLSLGLWICLRECSRVVLKFSITLGIGLQNLGCTIAKMVKL